MIWTSGPWKVLRFIPKGAIYSSFTLPPLQSREAQLQQRPHKAYLDFLTPANSDRQCLLNMKSQIKASCITYIICSECCQTAKSNPSKKRWHRPVQRSRSSSRTGKNSTPTFSWQSPWCPLWRPVLRRHIQPRHAFSYHPLLSFWNAPNTLDPK